MEREAIPAKLQEGTVDPYTNETITHVAEHDERAMRGEFFHPVLILMFIVAFLAIPFGWIFACILFFMVRNSSRAAIRDTHLYVTDKTLIYTRPYNVTVTNEIERITVPLVNIATVTVEGGVLFVNIKPTAPEVTMRPMRREDHNIVTRSVPVKCLKNPESFAEIVTAALIASLV